MHQKLFAPLFLLACAAALVAGVAEAQDDGTIKWLDNYQEALRQAKQTRKPILVEFRCEA